MAENAVFDPANPQAFFSALGKLKTFRENTDHSVSLETINPTDTPATVVEMGNKIATLDPSIVSSGSELSSSYDVKLGKNNAPGLDPALNNSDINVSLEANNSSDTTPTIERMGSNSALMDLANESTESAVDVSDASLPPALTDFRQNIHSDLNFLVNELNCYNWGPLTGCLNDLFQLILLITDDIFHPNWADTGPERLDSATKLQGKIAFLKHYVSCPSVPVFQCLLEQIQPLIPPHFLDKFLLIINRKNLELISYMETHSEFFITKIVSPPENVPCKIDIFSNPNSPVVSDGSPESHEQTTTTENVEPMADISSTQKNFEPIFIKPEGDWKMFITQINSILQKPPSVKLHGELAKFSVKTADDFITLKTYCSQQNYENVALTPPDSRPRKVVIKGLPATTTCSDIVQELKIHGFTATQLVNMRHRTTKVPMPLFLADITPSQNFLKIFEIKSLLFLRVYISNFNSKRPRQCYRCQRFGHSSLVCNFAPRCVKCAGEHKTETCSKPSNTPATCVNCKGAHTANYSGCPENPDIRRKNKLFHSKTQIAKDSPSIPMTNNSTKISQIPSNQTTILSPALASTSTWGNNPPGRKRKKEETLSGSPDSVDTAPSKKSTKKSNHSASANTNHFSPATEPLDVAQDAGVFFSVLSEIRELCSEFNMYDLLNLLKCSRIEMNKHTDVAQRFTILFTSIFSFFGVSALPTPVPCEQRI